MVSWGEGTGGQRPGLWGGGGAGHCSPSPKGTCELVLPVCSFSHSLSRCISFLKVVFFLFYTICKFMKIMHSSFFPLQKNGVKFSCQKAFF